MMTRRELAWITNAAGELVAVGVVVIDQIGQRWSTDIEIDADAGEQLHIPGVRLPEPV